MTFPDGCDLLDKKNIYIKKRYYIYNIFLFIKCIIFFFLLDFFLVIILELRTRIMFLIHYKKNIF